MKKQIGQGLAKATHEGKIHLGDKILKVAVLSNGTRIINQTDLFKAFGRPKRGSRETGDQGGVKLPGLIDAKNLKPFISSELEGVIKEVEFVDLNGRTSQGYDAIVLPLICDVYLEARKQRTADGKPILTGKQLPNADAAEILLRALSKVGIIALVDEATGYQYDRERDELQKILTAFIAPELLPWQKKFPDVFYYEIFRLNGWDYTVSSIKKRPGVVGKWTNKLIYEQLPKGVLEELKRKTPKSSGGNYTARFFQSLTEDIGHPALQAQINSVIALFQVSDNWGQFLSHFNRMVSRRNGQLELKLEDLAPSEEIKELKQESLFNRQLKGLMKVPRPKE